MESGGRAPAGGVVRKRAEVRKGSLSQRETLKPERSYITIHYLF